jgi:hypothetical protein
MLATGLAARNSLWSCCGRRVATMGLRKVVRGTVTLQTH